MSRTVWPERRAWSTRAGWSFKWQKQPIRKRWDAWPLFLDSL